MQCPMDPTDRKPSFVTKHQFVNESSSNSSPSDPAMDRSQRKCDANETTEQIPLAENPSILLHVLSSYELDPNDLAALEIAAGNCYLLVLAYEPTGMSVYSVRCGQGGKPGHGCRENLRIPKLIEHFQTLHVKPLSISAGAFHCAVLTVHGRVFTWGWSTHGCLGHHDIGECEVLPRAVAGLGDVKARHLSAGYCTTFVVADNGDVYSFGWDDSLNLGIKADDAEKEDVWTPKLATSVVALDEKFVQISATNTWDWINQDFGYSHTLALTKSGRLYSFGRGKNGQLGVKLAEVQERRSTPDRVGGIDLA